MAGEGVGRTPREEAWRRPPTVGELGHAGMEVRLSWAMAGARAGARLLGPKVEKGNERIKHHFKSNLDSNLNPFANFDQPKHHKNKYASA